MRPQYRSHAEHGNDNRLSILARTSITKRPAAIHLSGGGWTIVEIALFSDHASVDSRCCIDEKTVVADTSKNVVEIPTLSNTQEKQVFYGFAVDRRTERWYLAI